MRILLTAFRGLRDLFRDRLRRLGLDLVLDLVLDFIFLDLPPWAGRCSPHTTLSARHRGHLAPDCSRHDLWILWWCPCTLLLSLIIYPNASSSSAGPPLHIKHSSSGPAAAPAAARAAARAAPARAAARATRARVAASASRANTSGFGVVTNQSSSSAITSLGSGRGAGRCLCDESW